MPDARMNYAKCRRERPRRRIPGGAAPSIETGPVREAVNGGGYDTVSHATRACGSHPSAAQWIFRDTK